VTGSRHESNEEKFRAQYGDCHNGGGGAAQFPVQLASNQEPNAVYQKNYKMEEMRACEMMRFFLRLMQAEAANHRGGAFLRQSAFLR
jgi:hypothetical protein